MAHEPLHVVQVSFFADAGGRSPAQLLDAWSTLGAVADAACGAGVRVSVVQACARSERLRRKGVDYHFLPFGAALQPIRRHSAFSELLGHLRADVLHVQGLDFPRDVLALAALAPGIPIVLQDHASRPPRLWRRALWRRGMSAAAAMAFCALDQARPFAQAGLVDAATRLYEIPESTSSFAPGGQQQARHLTGLEGNPGVLWVGHLDANKDPLTVLEGISDAARNLPGLRLHCCFASAPLLRAVQARVARDLRLRDRVQLLGRLPHARIELLMRAADIFILGSHREGSGYSLIEALACGLPPVVTDIPSFRSLTGAGKVGMLWPCEDARAASEALQAIAGRLGSGLRAAVREHFECELSADALGRKLAAMYADVLQRTPAPMTPPRRRQADRAVGIS
ncbi:MAG TPA: glycosyltransferase family 4 protein [Steroidobacteraceae bacterium]